MISRSYINKIVIEHKIEKNHNFLSQVTFKAPSGKLKFNTSTSFKHHIINMLITFIVYEYNQLNIENLSF